MRKFIIREDTVKDIRETLQKYIKYQDECCAGHYTGVECGCHISGKECSQWITDVLHDFDTGLCTLSPYMPDHLSLGNGDCCGIFMVIDDKNVVICNECGMSISDAISKLWNMEDCSICHGKGSTTDHHDPCSECGGTGKVGG